MYSLRNPQETLVQCFADEKYDKKTTSSNNLYIGYYTTCHEKIAFSRVTPEFNVLTESQFHTREGMYYIYLPR